MAQQTFKTWRTVRLGGFREGMSEVHKVLRNGKLRTNNSWVGTVLKESSFPLSHVFTDVELVRIKAKKLGFRDSAKLEEVCCRAKELGLDQCPAECGLLLCMSLDKDRSAWSKVTLAMFPFADLRGIRTVFHIERWRFEQPCLGVTHYLEFVDVLTIRSEDELVFARRK